MVRVLSFVHVGLEIIIMVCVSLFVGVSSEMITMACSLWFVDGNHHYGLHVVLVVCWVGNPCGLCTVVC